MRRLLTTLPPLAVLATSLAIATTASAATGVATAHEFAPREVIVKFEDERAARTLTLPAGSGVRGTAAALRRNARVEYAEPNYIATASALTLGAEFLIPNDSGGLAGASGTAVAPGEWTFKQWNFLPWEEVPGGRPPSSPGGIDAIAAWRNLFDAGRAGANGITVAVLDTGVAYRSQGSRFRRSPDFVAAQFLKGYDFSGDDPLPLDENGHGTHVTGTIAEKTDNGTGLTGLAYRAKVLPVRVLDRYGRGDATAIAKGIRFAIANRVQVINMSFNFGCGKSVPIVDEALREAYRHGIVTVASAGNLGSESCVSAPATGPAVIGVGGTTEGACLGDYSLAGEAIDIVAPGGGVPLPGCPSVSARPIYQVTLKAGSTSTFGIPSDYVGTSMAAAHVSGVAAMVLASGVIDAKPGTRQRVRAVTRRLRATARNLGLPALQQGAGLLDAGRATDPAV
jgi:serine protease